MNNELEQAIRLISNVLGQQRITLAEHSAIQTAFEKIVARARASQIPQKPKTPLTPKGKKNGKPPTNVSESVS